MTETAERTGLSLSVCSARLRCGEAPCAGPERQPPAALGDVYHVRSSQFRVRVGGQGSTSSRTFTGSSTPSGPGGALIDIGVYQLDALLWLLGNPGVKTVLCPARWVKGSRPQPPSSRT